MVKKIILSGREKVLETILPAVMAIHQIVGDIEVEADGYSPREVSTKRKYRPLVRLFFKQYENINNEYGPDKGEIGFRIMNQSTTTITNDFNLALANKIKNKFCDGLGYLWKKGKVMTSYSDWDKGYQLQLLSSDKANVKALIETVLDLQGHSPDWSFMNSDENENPAERYPDTREYETILGERTLLPRARPITEVRFAYAKMRLHGRKQEIVLVDRTNRQKDPLVVVE